uniref:KRAB domain-containing protein n=1 Tax=Sus scrofa TaxID=9823 RepID=A0A8D1YR29_PIG
MAEAEAQRENAGSTVTLKDLFIHFTQEEWEPLDEDQKHLYCNMMPENFALVISLRLTVSRSHIISQPEIETYISNPHPSQHKKVHTTVRPVDEVNVGNSSLIIPASAYTRDFTIEQDFMCSPCLAHESSH